METFASFSDVFGGHWSSRTLGESPVTTHTKRQTQALNVQ